MTDKTPNKFYVRSIGYGYNQWESQTTLADAMDKAKSKAKQDSDPVGVFQLVTSVTNIRKDEDFAIEKVS